MPLIIEVIYSKTSKNAKYGDKYDIKSKQAYLEKIYFMSQPFIKCMHHDISLLRWQNLVS